jgi:hypothetical protein
VPGFAEGHRAEVSDLRFVVDDEDVRHGLSSPLSLKMVGRAGLAPGT